MHAPFLNKGAVVTKPCVLVCGCRLWALTPVSFLPPWHLGLGPRPAGFSICNSGVTGCGDDLSGKTLA